MKDYYKILGLDPSADELLVKKAYKEIAMRLYSGTVKNVDNSKDLFVDLTEAYEVLKDPEKRSIYDKQYQDVFGLSENEGQSILPVDDVPLNDGEDLIESYLESNEASIEKNEVEAGFQESRIGENDKSDSPDRNDLFYEEFESYLDDVESVQQEDIPYQSQKVDSLSTYDRIKSWIRLLPNIVAIGIAACFVILSIPQEFGNSGINDYLSLVFSGFLIYLMIQLYKVAKSDFDEYNKS